MKTPPDHILKAYNNLIYQSFLFFRSNAYACDERAQERAHDLADAMHNVGGILTDYGGWTDDKQYREIYLRPFDRKWGADGFRLEDTLDESLDSVLHDEK